ncbi:MAG TPA: DsbA family protein [Flavitalea sp.]|nr:DsbA family protein [Flavitalea sp.]
MKMEPAQKKPAKPLLVYCYDAYCGWCYGFSPVIKKIAEVYKEQVDIEVFSGGMILSPQPAPIGVMAPYIREAYKTVEERTGIEFGKDFLWHIFNPDKSDWFPDSLKPAIALCIFKEFYPCDQVSFAASLQYALNYEGRDLTDDEAYRRLLHQYRIPEEDFYDKLHSREYEQKAQYEFALVKQLKVTGFPTAFIQAEELKFYMIARGYTDYDTVAGNIDNVLKEIHHSGVKSS